MPSESGRPPSTDGVADIPVSREAAVDVVLAAVARALAEGRRVVLATVLARRGSTPASPGQKLALLGPSEALGTVGGGAFERELLLQMRGMLTGAASQPAVRSVDLHAELGMQCGGSVDVLLEPLGATLRALIVGVGHVGSALAPLLLSVGFRVVVCDRRGAVVEASGLPASPHLQLLHAAHDEPAVLQALGAPAAQCAALVMTHDHELDAVALEWAVRCGFAFVGGVGSQRKAQQLVRRLTGAGMAPADVGRVRMPLGVEIGARTPAEIGVAITAELIAWRRASAGVVSSGRSSAGSQEESS